MEAFQSIFSDIINIASTVVNIWGVVLISISVIKEIYKAIFVYKFDTEKISLDSSLNHGLASALEILLAGEILGTVVAYSMENLIHIAVLVVIRVFIIYVLNWELGHKEKKEKTK